MGESTFFYQQIKNKPLPTTSQQCHTDEELFSLQRKAKEISFKGETIVISLTFDGRFLSHAYDPVKRFSFFVISLKISIPYTSTLEIHFTSLIIFIKTSEFAVHIGLVTSWHACRTHTLLHYYRLVSYIV